MLDIVIPKIEFYDEEKNEFLYFKSQKIAMEHSLISISKWESKYHESFLNKKDFSEEQLAYYIKCMIVTPNVDNDNIYNRLTSDIIQKIQKYIDDPMTATTFSEIPGNIDNKKKSVITSELIYYYMISYGIPMECQKWHINRLITLLKVFSIKNGKPKKMSKQEIMERNRRLNAERKAKLNTRG